MVRPAPVAAGFQVAGQALNQAGSMLTSIADKERKQAEKVQLTDLDTFAEETWTVDFHDDEHGFKRQKGQAAFGGEKDLISGYEKKLDEKIAGFASPRVREAAAQRKAQIMASRRREVENYIGQQREVAKGASLVARKATGLDSLALNYADPALRAETMADVEDSIRSLAVSDEVAEAEVAEYRKQADLVVLRRFLDEKDTKGAKAYFAQAADRLGKDASRVRREIETAGRDEEAEDKAIGFVEAARDGESGRVDRAKAEAKLDGIKDVGLRDEARRRLEHRLSLEERAWTRQEIDHENSAITAYERGGNSLAAISSQDKDWLIAYAPKRWQAIERMAQADADRWRLQRERGERSGSKATPEETEAYGRFVLDLANDPQKYRTMTEEEFRAEWRTQLSDSTYKEAVQRLASHQQDKEAVVGDQKRMREVAFASAGITVEADQKKLTVEMDNWIQSEKARPERNGRAPSHKEIQEWLEKATEDVVMKGRVFGTTTRPRFLADPERITARNAGEIPASDRATLIQSYRERVGNPSAMPSDDQLLRAYQHILSQPRLP